jgi:short-subunit dehydrogenase
MASSRWQRYFAGKRVWVTGASSGIGRALVEALGGAGVATLASARNAEALDELAGQFESVSALPLDIVDVDALDEKTARAWDMLGGIDILVNNAGISQRFAFADGEVAALRRVIDVNLTGTMALTHAVIKRMLAAGSGRLVTVTSWITRLPIPLRTMYAATKFALHGFFDALRGEVESQGIGITLIVPGIISTPISQHAVSASGTAHGGMDTMLAQGLPVGVSAERMLRGIAREKREFAVARTPRLLYGALMRKIWPSFYFKAVSKVRTA